MSFDNAGLRRRSPNPNSPLPQPDIPYSPALLSPYINVSGNDGRGLGLSHTYNDPFERYHSLSPFPGPSVAHTQSYANPTIRLVPSGEPSEQATRHAPPTIRSKSNDEVRRAEAEDSALAALKRHRTDPKSYPASGRTSRESFVESHIFPREVRDRPVPPLPLDIKRGRWSRPPSIVSSGSSASGRTGEGTIGSLPTTPRERRPNSALSSLKSLRNPFARRPRSSVTASPVPSVRSILSSHSSQTLASRSSTSTLPVPFYPTAFFKSFGAEGKDALSKLPTPLGEKVTSKFPSPAPLRPESGSGRWTGYKWLLLFSVLTVSSLL